MSAQSPSSRIMVSSPESLTLWQRLEKPVTCILLTLAISLLASSLSKQKAKGSEVPEIVTVPSSTQVAAHADRSPLASGIYRYSQAAEAEQGSNTYMIFETRNNRVVGAFYVPQSFFDCFEGEIRGNQMALTIRNSSNQTGYAFSIPLQQEGAIASNGAAAAPVQLIGFSPVSNVTPSDRHLLATCKVNVDR